MLLNGDISRVCKWSDKTITESFEIRFACGTRGYNFLRKKKGYPFPSIRTQQFYFQGVHFDSGILTERKIACMSEDEKDCGLILDEMSIDQVLSYCNNNKNHFGNITIAGEIGKATHALIFMLVGIHSRWKQVVAYYLTGSSIPQGFLKDTSGNIIRKAEAIGLRVHFETSDCGPNNVRMWNDYGLKHSKGSVLNSCSVQHPVRTQEALEILPDATHVFKSTVQGWVKNHYIYLPDETVTENGLTNNVANISHLQELVAFEKEKELKMASRHQRMWNFPKFLV
ncbi:uncharacterized protein LOC129723331 [Wyeomyia smithii]|uniref:uncharacterized protein LOC129723331 n=1 Tax=Wyeomyia smithii TaxID=174621 RepID=UPI002467B6BE|nr:uncharacterized protein LOC129723331 [Wyeomyia smithii]